MPVIGHDSVRRQLERSLPSVALLRGPRSVGKRTLAEHLVEHHGFAKADRYVVDGALTIHAVRGVCAFVATAAFGPAKFVLLDLDEASEPALNALLKPLEEPPPATHFMLTASRPLPATLLSRCRIYIMGPLPRDALHQILLQQGLTPTAASRAAIIGCGQVERALRSVGADQHRDVVVELMKAVAAHDQELFDRTVRAFADDARDLLIIWLVEALTHRWILFSEAEMFGLHHDRKLLRLMIQRLSAIPAAQTRLAVRVALEPFLTA
jgi:DNA polymerase III delta prime subunit